MSPGKKIYDIAVRHERFVLYKDLYISDFDGPIPIAIRSIQSRSKIY